MTRLKIYWAFLFCALLVSGNGSYGADNKPPTFKTRLWASVDGTRLVFESDEVLNYSIASYNEPARLVIDVMSAKGRIDIKNNLSLAKNYIEGMRTSRNSETTLRAVFDLSAAVDYKVSRLSPFREFKNRLVFDIKPQEKPDLLLALIKSLESKPFIVLIDPGHGGEDPGAVSRKGNYEKDIVLSISKEIQKNINKRTGFKAFLTRDHDRFVKLFDRVNRAHSLHADAFISIHADSVKSPKARGSSVYVLSEKGATSKHAKRLAEEANLSDLIGGATTIDDPALDIILRELSKDGKNRASQLLATHVLKNIGTINHLHSKSVEAAGFAVLKSPSIPSILIETAYLSNPTEEKILLDKAYQKKLAIAVADALEKVKKQIHVE